MSESDNNRPASTTAANQPDTSEKDLMSRGIWHAPHGRKTKVIAWVILVAMAVCIVATVVAVAAEVLF